MFSAMLVAGQPICAAFPSRSATNSPASAASAGVFVCTGRFGHCRKAESDMSVAGSFTAGLSLPILPACSRLKWLPGPSATMRGSDPQLDTQKILKCDLQTGIFEMMGRMMGKFPAKKKSLKNQGLIRNTGGKSEIRTESPLTSKGGRLSPATQPTSLLIVHRVSTVQWCDVH